MMKALLIHTDGYTIDVVGQYDSVEEASRNLYLEYEKMCSQEIYHIVITKMRFYISMEKMCMSGRL